MKTLNSKKAMRNMKILKLKKNKKKKQKKNERQRGRKGEKERKWASSVLSQTMRIEDFTYMQRNYCFLCVHGYKHEQQGRKRK